LREAIKYLTQADMDRFWSYVDMREHYECWLWKGTPSGVGYGRFNLYGKGQVYAHQVSAFILYGWPTEDKQLVCHSCDVPLCCNPFHLFYGSQSDNMYDCANKGRNAVQKNPDIVRGQRNGRAKFTDDQVREIRATGMSRIEIVRKYGVSRTLAGFIRRRKTWKHLR